MLLTKPAERSVAVRGSSLVGAYVSTFFLTLTNPMTILSFAVAFAGLGLASADADYASARVLVPGVFLGPAAWWVALSAGVGAARYKVDAH
jgi:hypothetical protein